MNQIPAHWQWVTLNDLKTDEPGAITDGPFGSNLTSAHYATSGARVVRLQNIGDGRFIDAEAFISEPHFQSLRKHDVQQGDLLIASLGESHLRACLAPDWLGPAIVKADCIRARLSPLVAPRWVLYALQTPLVRKWAGEQLHGVGRPRLGLKVIRALPVPLPPLAEQRRIVDLLEDHLSRLEAAESLVSRSQIRVETLRLSRLTAWRRQLATEPASGLVPVGEVADTALGKMLDAKKAVGQLTPYLRNINVRWGWVDVSDVSEVRLTSEERLKFSLRTNDLLMCEGGEPGRCAIWNGPEGMTFQKALHRIRVRDLEQVMTSYLALMLEEFIRAGGGERLYTGTTIKHLPQEKLRQIAIPLPSLLVQSEVVADLESVTANSRLLAQQLKVLTRRSAVLRRSLLGAAFSGRLTSQGHLGQELAHV